MNGCFPEIRRKGAAHLRRLAAGVILLILTSGPPLFAQALGPSRRDVAAQSSGPVLNAENVANHSPAGGGTAPLATGLGSEFGEQQIVQRRAHVEPWSAAADAQYFYTDNAALAPNDARGDGYLRAGAVVAYTNRIKGNCFVDFSLQEYFFRYAHYGVLDFDLTRFTGGLVVQAPMLGDAFFAARYRLERLTEPGFGHALFTNHVAELSVQKTWKISRGQQIFASLEADLPIDTSPRPAMRAEYGATLGYSLRLTERLTASASYRVFWYDYLEVDRNEWNHLAALGATYDLTDWLRLGLSVTYTHSDASGAFGGYDNFVAGGSASLHVAF